MAKSKGTNKEKYERYYNAGWYNEEMLWNMVLKNKITAEDYEEITGKKHEDEAWRQRGKGYESKIM